MGASGRIDHSAPAAAREIAAAAGGGAAGPQGGEQRRSAPPRRGSTARRDARLERLTPAGQPLVAVAAVQQQLKQVLFAALDRGVQLFQRAAQVGEERRAAAAERLAEAGHIDGICTLQRLRLARGASGRRWGRAARFWLRCAGSAEPAAPRAPPPPAATHTRNRLTFTDQFHRAAMTV